MIDIIYDEEVVLCEKTFSAVTKKIRWMIIGIIVFVLSFLINVIVGLLDYGNAFAMFEDGGPYWIGFGHMILGLIIFLIGLYLYLKSSDSSHISSRIVLTNKRIISTRYLTEEIYTETSILLEHITNFRLVRDDATHTYTLTVSTEDDSYSFGFSDTEMYDALVKIVRAYK